MEVWIVTPHSFADTITNSSTDLFICGTTRTREEILHILKLMWQQYLKEQKKLKPEERDYDRGSKLLDVLDVCVITKGNIHEWQRCVGYYTSQVLVVGDVLIEGQDDNSIPWAFQEMIADTLSARRIHMG